MKLQDLQGTFDKARDAITVKRVFGEPYQQNGVTVIPAASVAGGAGGGEGEGEGGEGKGTNKGIGGGFGVTARPAGVYVIKGESVAWQPAIDVNRVIAGAQLVAIVLLLTVREIVKARAKGREARAVKA